MGDNNEKEVVLVQIPYYAPVKINLKKLEEETQAVAEKKREYQQARIMKQLTERQLKPDNSSFAETAIGFNYQNLLLFFGLERNKKFNKISFKTTSGEINKLYQAYQLIKLNENCLNAFNEYLNQKNISVQNQIKELSPVFSTYLFYFTPDVIDRKKLGDQLLTGGFGYERMTVYDMYQRHTLKSQFGNDLENINLLLMAMNNKSVLFFNTVDFNNVNIDDVNNSSLSNELNKFMENQNMLGFPASPFFKIIKMVAFCSSVYENLPSSNKNLSEVIRTYYQYLQGYIYDGYKSRNSSNQDYQYIYKNDKRPNNEQQIGDLKTSFSNSGTKQKLGKILDFDYLKELEEDNFFSGVVYIYFLYCMWFNTSDNDENPFINVNNPKFYENLVKKFYTEFKYIVKFENNFYFMNSGKDFMIPIKLNNINQQLVVNNKIEIKYQDDLTSIRGVGDFKITFQLIFNNYLNQNS